MFQRTLAIIKPDAYKRRLVGNIITTLELEGFKIIAMKLIHMTEAQAQGFYRVHRNKPFYKGLTEFMTSGPCVVMVLEGEDVIKKYRKLMGATDYKKAEPGTIRYELATSLRHNVVHGSDSEESAEYEIDCFFNQLEIVR